MNYPQSYLDAPIQTNSEDFPIELLFYTNADVIAGKIERPKGFIDPFGDPDSWRKYRESCDYKPKAWKSYIELNVPWLDPKKEFKAMKKFRGDKDRLERMRQCGIRVYSINAYAGKTEADGNARMCRDPECPKCGPYLIEKRADELKKVAFKKNSKMIEVSEEEALKMARKLKEQFGAYERYPGKDGKITFIITPEDDQETPEGFEDLTFTKCDEIAKDSIMAKGKRASVVGPKEEPKEENQEEIEEEKIDLLAEQPIEVTKRKMEIGFNEIIKDEKDLQVLIEAEVEIDKSPETIEELQYAIYLMERTAKKVCEEKGLLFNFVVTSKERVLLSKVNWNWIKEKQKRLLLA